jgi:hypothetical protein
MISARLASMASVLVVLTACGNGSSRGGRDGGVPDAGHVGPVPDADTGPAKGWSAPVQVGAARNIAQIEIHGVDVALNDAGTALVAWDEDADTAGSAWIAWYRAKAWQPALQVSEGSVHAHLPRVALNASGAAVVAFEVVEHEGPGIASRTVWARRWTGVAWTAAQRISAAPTASYQLYASRPRVGMDGAGRAFVVYDQQDSSSPAPPAIYASRFDGAQWNAPMRVNDGTLYAAWGDLAVNADGTAVVAWVQSTNPHDPNRSGGGPTNPNIWARRFDGSAWSAPLRIGADLADYEGCERVRVVMDGAGRAFAIWEERKRDVNRIAAARFSPGSGWSARDVLDSAGATAEHLSFPAIATDGRGGAFGVWQKNPIGGSVTTGFASRYGPSGWSAPLPFESTTAVQAAVAAMDGAGNAWAVFTAGGLRARMHDTAAQWQTTESIGSMIVTAVAANSAGMMVAVGHGTYVQSNPPAFLDAARTVVYVP